MVKEIPDPDEAGAGRFRVHEPPVNQCGPLRGSGRRSLRRATMSE